MIRVSIEELTMEHVLARSIFRPNGELLLAAGYRITEAVLRKLKEMEQNYFWVHEEGLESINPQQMISEYIQLQTTNELRQNGEKFRKVLGKNLSTLEDIKKVMSESGRFRNIIAAEGVQNMASSIISDIMYNDAALINLNTIRTKSNFIYEHSIDVAICAIMIGKKFGFARSELEELAMGSILLDTGYMIMPEEVVNRKGRLSFADFSMLKEHPTVGYSILRENPKIPLVSAHVAFQHHERQDGGGYPRRLKGRNEAPYKTIHGEKNLIHRYAEVAAVADFYVSLENPRPGTPRKNPSEIIKILLKSAGTHLNKTIVDVLIGMVPIYPIGAQIVVIRDSSRRYVGYQGVVSKITDPASHEKPEIVLIKDDRGKKIRPVKILLSEETGVEIQHAVLR